MRSPLHHPIALAVVLLATLGSDSWAGSVLQDDGGPETGGAAQEAAAEEVEDEREASEVLLRTIEEIFERWCGALEAGDPEALRVVLDPRGVVQRAHALSPAEALKEPRLVLRVVEGLIVQLTAAPGRPWDELEILDATIGEDTGQLVVETLSRRQDAPDRLHARWLMRQEGEGWRVVDRVDLSSGMALSWIAARGYDGAEGAPAWTVHLDEFLRAIESMGSEDFDAVAYAIESIGDAEFPAALRGTMGLMRARLALHEGRAEAALRWISEVRRMLPDLPEVRRVEALVHALREDWQAAERTASEYSTLLPGDVEMCFVEGQAAAALGRLDVAVAAFRTGLSVDPQSVDCLLGLARAMDKDGNQELRDRFRRLENPTEWFEPLVLELFATGDLDDVEALIQELRNIAPTDPNGDYYEATLLTQRGRVREAADLLRNAFPKVADPAEQRFYVQQYTDACVLLGVPMEAYENAPDGPFVFDLLSSYYLEVGRLADLESLANRHELDFPDDPWLPYYRGELLRAQGQLSAAALRFEEGLLNAKDDETREVYRWNLVRAWAEDGRAMKAYEEVEPRESTYAQLALHALELGDEAVLELLLGARRVDRPDDPELPLLEGIQAYWRGEDALAIERISAGRGTLDPQSDLVVHVERSFILAALRTGEYDLAQEAARASTLRDGDPLFEAIVLAARGEHERCVNVLRRCLTLGYEVETLYGDPDLGPTLLAHEAYANFRAVHPPQARPAEGAPEVAGG